MDHELALRVDGAEHRLSVDPRTSLLDALRQRLGNTSTTVTVNSISIGVSAW